MATCTQTHPAPLPGSGSGSGYVSGACALRSLLNSCSGGVFAPGPLPQGPCVPLTTPCCTRPRCQRLRVIVIYAQPWTTRPGSTPSGCTPPMSRAPNQPPARCQAPLTGGLPWTVKLAAKSGAYLVYDPMPADVAATYGTYANQSQSFMFDFGTACPRAAEGTMLAYGQAGCVQASLKFVYRWCGPQTARVPCFNECVELPQFEVLDCTYKNARFDVLDTYLSSDPCTESVVVMEIRQWCRVDDPDAVIQPEDELPPCNPGTLNCVEQALLKPCIGPCKRPRRVPPQLGPAA